MANNEPSTTQICESQRRSLIKQRKQPDDPIPKSPVYSFANKLQPPEFTKGVHAALERIADVKEHVAGADEVELTAALYAHLQALVAKGGDFGAGAFALVCNCIIAGFSVSLDLDLWRPFERCWEGEDNEIPPHDCMFFDVEGVPYSVEPSLATIEWYSECGGWSRNVEDIRGRAKPITRAEFALLRRNAGVWRAAMRSDNTDTSIVRH